MRKPHRKQLLAWLLTAALLLTNLPVSVLSEEVVENPIQTEILEQAEQKTDEEPVLPDSPPEEIGEPTEPPISQEPNETPESGGQSEIAEIPADKDSPNIPDQDESETPEPSDSDIEETPSPEVPEETPDTSSTDEPPAEEVPAEETPIPEESPLPDDEEAFSVSEAILEYGYAYAAANAESVIYKDAELTTPLFTLKEDGGVLLITEETETAFKVWWLTYADEPLSGYKQIAKLDGYGTIYATPHYLEGQTVYCLEHTMNSPGAKDNPTGPFEVVDLDGYAVKPGYSGDIYSSRTMHAIGWVLRHTYPHMIVDTGYEDSDVWSRVAGQFAIREVVKQLEGDWYVRDYWRMDEFYRASGQAPADYLEYARWLASCAIRRSGITGDIGISNKSMTMQGSSYVGTVTLTTDADLIRISRSVGSLTGNSASSDGEYYYLRSGDTISVTSTQSTFAITAESVSSQDEEAAFLVGVPDADIQKVVIPQYGLPAKFKAVRIEFEQPYGAIVVTKTSASSGAALSGAVFELLNSAGAVLQSQTTGADGSATFSNVQAGTYTVREKNAPQGYQVSIQSSQTVTVTAGATSRLSFANAPIQGKIRIVKTDSLTHEPLAGVVFTVTRLSTPAGSNGAAVGSVVATLTTGADGSAETDRLEWGRYRISEVQAPEHYADKLFSAEIDCMENGKTYEITATNEANPGFIRISKTAAGSRVPLAGIQFDIYYNDEYGSGLAGTMTTDENGVAIAGPLRKGKYHVREHELPQGFSGYPIELTATVYSDETTRLSAENQMIQGKIRIVKTDSLTHEPLAGVQFIITRLSAPPSANGTGVGETILLTTNEQGAAETGWLDYGRYENTDKFPNVQV